MSGGGEHRLSALFTWRSAICDSELPSTSRHVALTLSLHMSERGDSCFPSVRRLADETGLSRRTVQRHLKELVEAGWLVQAGWKTWETPGGEQRTKMWKAQFAGGRQSVTPLPKGASLSPKGASESAQRGRHSDTQGRYEDDKGRSGSRPSRRKDGKPSGPGDVSVTDAMCPVHDDEPLRSDARGLYCLACGEYVDEAA